jgi:hypothetical protein
MRGYDVTGGQTGAAGPGCERSVLALVAGEGSGRLDLDPVDGTDLVRGGAATTNPACRAY